MTRRNVSLPDDLDEAARHEGLNVSSLTQRAIVSELDRRARMARLGAWLDELDAENGPPSEEAVAEAKAWVVSAVPAAGAHPASTEKKKRRGTPPAAAKAGRTAKSASSGRFVRLSSAKKTAKTAQTVQKATRTSKKAAARKASS